MNKRDIEELARNYANKSDRKTIDELEYNYHLYNGTTYASKGFFDAPHEQVEGDCSLFTKKEFRRMPFGTTVLQRLAAEMQMHEHKFRANLINANATSRFEQQKNESIAIRFNQIVKEIAESGNDDELEAKVKQLQKEFGLSYQSNIEKCVNEIVEMLLVDGTFRDAMRSGVGHRIASGTEAYYWITNQAVPILVSVDPRDITTFGGGDRYENSDAVCVVERINVNTMMQRYGKLLNNGLKREYINRMPEEKEDFSTRPDAIIFPHEARIESEDDVVIRTVFMRVNKRMKIVESIGKDAVKYKHIMDGSYKPRPEEKATSIIVPQAVRVVFVDGMDSAILCEPEPIQNSYSHAYDNVPLGIYGDRGGLSWPNEPCVASMIASSQKELDLLYGKFIDMLHRNIGKILQVDLTNIPQGWTIDKYIDMIKNNGLSVVDSASAQALASNSLGTKETHVVDLELTSTISNLMGAMAKLENDIVTLSGVSRERMGMIGQYQSAASVAQAVNQSTGGSLCITRHNELAEKIMTVGVEIVRRGIAGQPASHKYMLSETTLELIRNDKDGINLVNYGIKIDDTIKANMKLELIQQEAGVALRNGSMTFADFLICLEAKSIEECSMLLAEAKEKEMYMMQQAAMAEQQAAQPQQQQQLSEQDKAQIRKQPESYEKIMLEKRKLDDSMEKFRQRQALNEKRLELAEKKFEQYGK